MEVEAYGMVTNGAPKNLMRNQRAGGGHAKKRGIGTDASEREKADGYHSDSSS